MTEARRVVEPDLLWIESVTDRLLGTAGRPAAWERVYFEGRDTVLAASEDEAPTEEQPAVDGPSAAPADPLPQRTPRDFDGPVSYRQPAAYVRPATVDPLADPPPVVDPSAAAEDEPEPEPPPERQEPLVSADPSPVDLAPVEPHLAQVRAPASATAAAEEPVETPRTEDMPPAVLRAALRDALPDVFSVRPAKGPADAVFGDPRWSLPPEEDDLTTDDVTADDEIDTDDDVAAADEIAAADDLDELPRSDEGTGAGPELADEDADRLRAAAAATAAEPTAPDDGPVADEPVQSPYFEPTAPEPHAPPSYADLGYGFPRSPDQLTVADVALRLAFRSADRELAEAVVRLVARQARERARLQAAEAYLDAILDEGDAALPGAARLRHILAD
jgi:hypothetical protein